MFITTDIPQEGPGHDSTVQQTAVILSPLQNKQQVISKRKLTNKMYIKQEEGKSTEVRKLMSGINWLNRFAVTDLLLSSVLHLG